MDLLDGALESSLWPPPLALSTLLWDLELLSLSPLLLPREDVGFLHLVTHWPMSSCLVLRPSFLLTFSPRLNHLDASALARLDVSTYPQAYDEEKLNTEYHTLEKVDVHQNNSNYIFLIMKVQRAELPVPDLSPTRSSGGQFKTPKKQKQSNKRFYLILRRNRTHYHCSRQKYH